MKVYGLIKIKSLYLSENEDANLENVILASYKMSEDGAKGIVIKGSFRKAFKILKSLKDKIDIPVFIYCESQNSLTLGKQNKIKVFQSINPSEKNYVNTFKIKSFKEALNTIICENEKILKTFREQIDFLPEIISTIAFDFSKKGCKIFITEEVISAVKGEKLSRLL